MFNWFNFGSLDGWEDIVAGFLVHQIYFAPIILLALEEIGIPVSADLVIAYIGYQVKVGHIPYFVAYLLLMLSDILGASILYYLTYRYGKKVIHKFGQYIDLDENKLDIVEQKFRKYGPIAIIVGRHIYGFKVPITIFSGISKMRYFTFALCVIVSDLLWIPLYLSIGQRLGPKTVHLFHMHHWILILAIIPILLSILPFLLMRKSNKKGTKPTKSAKKKKK